MLTADEYLTYGESLKVTCGLCDERKDVDHACESIDNDYVVASFAYAADSLTGAARFLKAYPEFTDSPVLSSVTVRPIVIPEDYDQYDLPLVDAAGNGVEEITREDEWDDQYANRDNYQAVRYFTYDDVEPTRCTHATNWWFSLKSEDYPKGIIKRYGYYDGPRVPNHMVEHITYDQDYSSLDYEDSRLNRLSFTELQGFTSQLLIDANITERYQFNFFNIYYGKHDQRLHVGLLSFEHTVDGRVRATCKRCNAALVTPGNATRTDMEDFVIACIRHGNNHGPDWLIRRKDFTFIHAVNCDATHPGSPHCNANRSTLTIHTLNPEDFNAMLDFLIQHRKFCRSSECRCTHYYHLLSEIDRERIAA